MRVDFPRPDSPEMKMKHCHDVPHIVVETIVFTITFAAWKGTWMLKEDEQPAQRTGIQDNGIVQFGR